MLRNGHKPLKKRPVGELVKQLAEETGALLRQEVALAKAEMLEKIEAVREEAGTRARAARGDLEAAKSEVAANGKQAGIGLAMFGAAAAFGLVALAIVALLLARLLDAVMPSAVALALVTMLYVAVAATLVVIGRNRLTAAAPVVPTQRLAKIARDLTGGTTAGQGLDRAWPPVPEQTIETLKEDVEWARHPTKFVRR